MTERLAVATITLAINEAYAARDSLIAMSEIAKEQGHDQVWSILVKISTRFNDMFTQEEWTHYHSQMSKMIAQENDTEGTE